jgi:hypothetical protein
MPKAQIEMVSILSIPNCYSMFRAKSVNMVDTSSACKGPKGPRSFI